MKTQLLNFFKFTACWLIFITTYTQQNAVYAIGDRTQNGGDTCEQRLLPLQDEIKNWLPKYDQDTLKMPEDVTHTDYQDNMTFALENMTISCTDRVLKIGEAEKTCINTVEPSGASLLECNIARTKATEDEDLITLMHHEAAGIAGFETNDGDERSDYFITDQLHAYFKKVTVTKLAIRPVNDDVEEEYYQTETVEKIAKFIKLIQQLMVKHQSMSKKEIQSDLISLVRERSKLIRPGDVEDYFEDANLFLTPIKNAESAEEIILYEHRLINNLAEYERESFFRASASAVHAAQTTSGAGGAESIAIPFAFVFDLIWTLPAEAVSRLNNNLETSDSRNIISFWLEY